jgi:hypothetical protein
MYRRFGFAALLSILAVGAFGCHSGLSAEDAKLRCDQERTSKSQCVDQAGYDQCVLCYLECGDQCVPKATCPSTYVCGDGANTSSTGAGTGSAGGSK